MDTIDAILYINLDHREDRKGAIIKQIQDIGFNEEKVYRIPAVLNRECGHIGCGLSHIKALDLAIQNKWNRILILEDDFHFKVSSTVLNKYISAVDKLEWDVLLLAKCQGKFENLSDNLQRVKWCTTTPGYIVQQHYFNTLRSNFMESIDIMNNELSTHIKRYIEPWTHIGNEFDTITIVEESRIRYGYGESWVEKTVLSSFKAINDFFGIDPYPAKRKNVEIYTPWKTFTTENKLVRIDQECRVRYGYGNYWIEKIVSSPFNATNTFFGGDPYPTKPKQVQLNITDVSSQNIIRTQKLYPKLINCTAIDQHWKILQAQDKFYTFEPVIGSQGGFSSDNF